MTYAIPHYPTRYIETRTLRNGLSVTLRPILPQDAQPSQQFVRALSQRSRYRRFHGAVNELAPAVLQHLTQVDYVRHLALVAETFEGMATVLVGEARFVSADDPQCAEFAIAVADLWQNQGVGRLLLKALLRAAKAAGLRQLYGNVLQDNAPMLALAQSMGFSVSNADEDPALLQVTIDPVAAERPQAMPAARGWDAWRAACQRHRLRRTALRAPGV